MDMCIRMGWINPILSKKDVYQGADLSNRTIVNLDLRRRYLKGIKINNTALLNTSFESCELSDASLFNTYLEKVNLTGTIMSRANFTAIHYSNKSRPIQLSHIDINGAKVDGVNFNGMHFENNKDKNNKLVDIIWYRETGELKPKSSNMYQASYWSEANQLTLGISIKKLMCDELTIFSYNESVYENIIDVYLIKDITSPDNRITPVTLSDII